MTWHIEPIDERRTDAYYDNGFKAALSLAAAKVLELGKSVNGGYNNAAQIMADAILEIEVLK